MALADPVGSILTPLVNSGKLEEAGSCTVEGISEDFVSPNANLSLVKRTYSVNDKASMLAVHDLLAKEGIRAGPSSGTLLSAELRYYHEQKMSKQVVTFVCDSGSKYLRKVFDDFSLDESEAHSNLSDLVAHARIARCRTVISGLGYNLLISYGRMRRGDVSQLSVLEKGRLFGVVNDSNIFAVVEGTYDSRWNRFDATVATAMSKNPHMLHADQTLDTLLSIFDRNNVAIFLDGEEPIGLITRANLINHLKRAK